MVKFESDFFGLKDYFSDQNSSANSSCPSTAATWCFDEYRTCIRNPTLIPLCILALIIGLVCSKRVARLPGKFPSRWYYQVAFLLYGIMMSSTGILYCFMGGPQQSSSMLANGDDDSIQLLQLLIGIIGVGFTTNIAITILFCGLCDIKYFNPQFSGTRYLLYLLYFFAFLLWTLGISNQWNWTFNVLYFGVLGVSCLIYFLTQLCIKRSRRALFTLFVAGLYGGFGLLATTFAAEHICESEGPFWSQYIGPEFISFLFSNISMAFLCVYVIRAKEKPEIKIKNYDIDIEKQPEKF